MSEDPTDVEPIDDRLVGDDAQDMLSPVATKVFDLLAPVVATAEVELLDVEWTGGTLRVVLDHADGVTTDNLATVNRLISPILDQHDPVPGRYTLEVSSPGVERPLRRLEHYRRAVGENIIVKTIASVEPRRVKGSLQAVADSTLTIDVTEVDGVDLVESEPRTVEIADISTARTVFEWGPTPKPGSGKSNKNPKKSQAKNSQAKKSQANKNKKNRPKTAGPGKTTANDNRSQQNRNEVGDE